MNGYQQLNGGNTTTSPTTTDKGEGLSLPRWAPIKEAIAAGKPLSPLGPTRAPEKPEHSHSFVSVGQAGRQGWPGLAWPLMGTRWAMGHGGRAGPGTEAASIGRGSQRDLEEGSPHSPLPSRA